MNSFLWRPYLVTCLACGLLLGMEQALGEQPTPENTSISDIMKEAHKKPKELVKRVALGRASQAEQQRLRDLYKVLAQHAPPRGDAASWQEKTRLLTHAAQAVVDGKPEALSSLAKATNCKACHEAHKP